MSAPVADGSPTSVYTGRVLNQQQRHHFTRRWWRKRRFGGGGTVALQHIKSTPFTLIHGHLQTISLSIITNFGNHKGRLGRSLCHQKTFGAPPLMLLLMGTSEEIIAARMLAAIMRPPFATQTRLLGLWATWKIIIKMSIQAYSLWLL